MGFYDPDVDASKALAESAGYTYFERQEDLIAASEVIDIVTPTLFIISIAKSCIAAGKHILLKNPSHSVAEAEELVALAATKKVKGQVGHVERFNPAYKAVKDNLGSPMFVESHRLAVNPRGDRCFGCFRFNDS